MRSSTATGLITSPSAIAAASPDASTALVYRPANCSERALDDGFATERRAPISSEIASLTICRPFEYALEHLGVNARRV